MSKFCIVALFLAGIYVLFATGCSDSNSDESETPWAKPANWEGKLPAFQTIRK